MLYSSWDMVHDGCNFYFTYCAIFAFFALKSRKIKFLKIRKKNPGDIIILHLCTKNHDQMMYGSWDMVGHGQTDWWMDRWTDRKSACYRLYTMKSIFFFVSSFLSPFLTSVPLLYPLKTSENSGSANVFRENNCGALVENGLKKIFTSDNVMTVTFFRFQFFFSD